MTAEQAGERASEQAWVWLARIRRAQGRKGEVLAEVLTDFPSKFHERKRVWLLTAAGLAGDAAREMQLDDFWIYKGGNVGPADHIVLHFAGVGSITEAEGLRGLVVAIPRAERVVLGEDEVYAGDLIGCLLVDVAATPARTVGLIEDVDRDAGPVALLVVRADGGSEELLIPFAKAYLRSIDLEGNRVEMALPEGLVEVQVSDNRSERDDAN